MSWAEVKKAINSDLSTPLDSLISSKVSQLLNTMGLHFQEYARYSTMLGTPSSFSKNYSGIMYVVGQDPIKRGDVVLRERAEKGKIIPLEKDTTYTITSTASGIYEASTVDVFFYKLGGGV